MTGIHQLFATNFAAATGGGGPTSIELLVLAGEQEVGVETQEVERVLVD